jgi:hypothetical protein
MNGIAIFGDQSQQPQGLFATHNAARFPTTAVEQMMTGAMMQVGIIVGVIALLFYLATRQPQNRRARRPSGASCWPDNTDYAVGDGGQHHGRGGDHSASGHSGGCGDSVGGDSPGGPDAGGGSGDSGGGGGDGGGGGGSD